MKKWFWFSISLLVVILDQLTKWAAETYLLPYQPYPVMPLFNLTLSYNTGAAFGFLNHAGEWHRWFFGAISGIMSIVFIVWMLRLPIKSRLQLAALSFLLGGTVGNLIDRWFFDHVIDFVDLYYQHHHFAVFNLADSAICLGAFLLLLDHKTAL